jgi:hypothetical protein
VTLYDLAGRITGYRMIDSGPLPASQSQTHDLIIDTQVRDWALTYSLYIEAIP